LRKKLNKLVVGKYKMQYLHTSEQEKIEVSKKKERGWLIFHQVYPLEMQLDK